MLVIVIALFKIKNQGKKSFFFEKNCFIEKPNLNHYFGDIIFYFK